MAEGNKARPGIGDPSIDSSFFHPSIVGEIRASNFPDTSGRGVALAVSSEKQFSKIHMGE